MSNNWTKEGPVGSGTYQRMTATGLRATISRSRGEWKAEVWGPDGQRLVRVHQTVRLARVWADTILEAA